MPLNNDFLSPRTSHVSLDVNYSECFVQEVFFPSKIFNVVSIGFIVVSIKKKLINLFSG